MLWKTWAAVGAFALGLLVPTLSGGDSFRGAAPLLVVAVLVGIVMTVIAVVAGGEGDDRQRRLPVAAANRSPEPEFSDMAILTEINRLVSKRDIDWLRRESFAGSWLADSCSRLREVALLEVGQHAISDPELRRDVSHLADAAGVFSHILVRNTIVDPIMRDPSWLTIGRIGADGEPETLPGRGRRTVQDQLRAASDDVCTAIDEILLHIGTHAPPSKGHVAPDRIRATR